VARLAASDAGNAEWQRDLIVSHFKMASAGSNPHEHLTKALEVAAAMEHGGILALSDGWIPEFLRDELAKLGAPAR
jgi:hypothetical protein